MCGVWCVLDVEISLGVLIEDSGEEVRSSSAYICISHGAKEAWSWYHQLDQQARKWRHGRSIAGVSAPLMPLGRAGRNEGHSADKSLPSHATPQEKLMWRAEIQVVKG